MLKIIGLTLAASIAAAISSTAVAVPVVTTGGTVVSGEGQTASVAGVSIINFNVGSTLPTGVSYDAAAGNLVTGSLSGVYAAPPGDSSRYLAVGPTTGSPVTITLSSAANYIGFFAASLDEYNTITFIGSSTTSYTGTQLAALAGIPAGGNQASGAYFNIFESGNDFTKVILASSQQALELDNFAVGRAAPPAPVPLPGTLALMGAALGLGLLRSRKK